MSFLTTGLGAVESAAAAVSSGDPFIGYISSKVIETIHNAKTVPGLDQAVFASLKPGLISRWDELVRTGVLEITATDAEVRPYYVALQAIVEHVLARELGSNVKSLTGLIHTPMPATPLCTKGAVSENLVHSDVAKDPARVFTVEARATIVRNYLHLGGDLYVAYPAAGLLERTEAQRAIYKEAVDEYPTHLFDCPLACDSIDPSLIGASYIFKNAQGESFAFAIKMTQANSLEPIGNFGLWFGKSAQPNIRERLSSVLSAILPLSEQHIDMEV